MIAADGSYQLEGNSGRYDRRRQAVSGVMSSKSLLLPRASVLHFELRISKCLLGTAGTGDCRSGSCQVGSFAEDTVLYQLRTRY
jgi:hypothetical protein